MSDSDKRPFDIHEDRPTDWFELLYAKAGRHGAGVPWANMTTHPAFSRWLERNPLSGKGKSALVVGCGMGDDAIELEKQGFDVTAFDVSESAIQHCKDRFPDSTVNFVVANLLMELPQWQRHFDFVLEIYTVQALPPKFEGIAIKHIANFVASKGTLLVIAEVSPQSRHFDNGPPWLLTPAHVVAFETHGLRRIAQDIEPPSSDNGRLGTFMTVFASG